MTVPPHRQALLAIFCVWALWLSVLAGLGWFDLGTGLYIWPMGEDRNWINLLMADSPGTTARGFWAIDHRNPLSPWWYIAFKPLIMGWPQGIYLLRQIVSLALAFSTYALIASWLGPTARRFATTVGCLVVVFTANAFFDQIYWNFHVALISSILCVTCYLRHQRSPGSGQWLAAALVLWLIAIATYTIQAGAIVAVAIAAWSLHDRHRGEVHLLRDWPGRLRDVILAAWPFAAILVLFILIWQTTSVPADSFVGKPSWTRLLQSLVAGLWHPDHVLMRDVLALSANRQFYWTVAAIVFVVAFAVLRPPRVAAAPLIGLIVLAGGLALPTLLVETVGTQWPPGSRWRMIYQFSTPVFFLALLAIVVTFLPARAARWLWRLTGAACFSLAALGSLAHNERQISLTATERELRRLINQDAASQPHRPTALTYLVILDHSNRWFQLDAITRVYARTWFPAGKIDFRLLTTAEPFSGLQAGPRVTFMSDEEGVANANLKGETLPYESIRLIRTRDRRFEVINRLAPGDFPGLRAEWRRTQPVLLAPCVPATSVCR